VVVAVSTRIALLPSFASVAEAVVPGNVAAVMLCTASVALVLLRHFFLWARLPCPGPGMLVVLVG
jgi:hypothetical protein